MKNLKNTLRLEAIQSQAEKMIEFSFDIGSLLLKEEEVKTEMREKGREQFKFQETESTVMIKNETVYKTEKLWCAIFMMSHVKVTDSKAKGVLDVVKILRDDGVLTM